MVTFRAPRGQVEIAATPLTARIVCPVRILLAAETFTPAVNGVVNSVLRTADALAARGHQPVVVAPSGETYRSARGHRVEVVRVPALSLPGYRGLRVARPGPELTGTRVPGTGLTSLVRDISPDVVHLASPALLGQQIGLAARSLDIPSVAVFQTDLAAFARRYRVGPAGALLWRWLRSVHGLADLTLAPSSATAYQLRRHGIGPVALWARGVDATQFHPSRRDERLRARLLGDAGIGGLLVGVVGRLAPEKRMELLAPLSRTPGVRVVVVGDGPRRHALERAMPDAHFTGLLRGTELGRTMASLDLLVHPGADETFCQVVQEALCAGVPVVCAAAGGPLDLVRHRDNGWLWPGGDADLLAAQVQAVREDPVEFETVRARTRASVVGRSWDRITDELLGHYAAVLTGGAGAGVASGGRRAS